MAWVTSVGEDGVASLTLVGEAGWMSSHVVCGETDDFLGCPRHFCFLDLGSSPDGTGGSTAIWGGGVAVCGD